MLGRRVFSRLYRGLDRHDGIQRHHIGTDDEVDDPVIEDGSLNDIMDGFTGLRIVEADQFADEGGGIGYTAGRALEDASC